jgi:hypothetical protein
MGLEDGREERGGAIRVLFEPHFPDPLPAQRTGPLAREPLAYAPRAEDVGAGGGQADGRARALLGVGHRAVADGADAAALGDL